ncbi:hypothetical protein CEUSTIGMA_g350.t1 [Chlamydomonas eustigma]|uniref:NADH dehydrogenase [ubiquinone] 1 alpha subcomplex subunit 12 n=1 Tax=Chlamydomonas eustigma TaxID=1157962 RepID=A0A250WPW6_9CHLO|nr:hypothetical protein CEUSTIGMA_g350.t1 [Chlamydomonas eustigma]|eukprot:GAX72895.1 hypothetical protein CEUSTIGMA_g350.t1 [Chlamydomonas eustigma]
MSLVTHINKVVEASGKKSIFGLIFSLEGLKIFADGNIAYNKVIRGPTAGNLVGTDSFGNRYYENNDLGYARKRWVLFQDTFNYNATSVSPEWHGWLNGINDFPPTRYEHLKPIYQVAPYITRTGTPQAYAPKGSWANSHKRNWKKVEFWQPPVVKS